MLIHVVLSRNNTLFGWSCKKAYTNMCTALDTAEAEGEDENGYPLGYVTSITLINEETDKISKEETK